MSINALIGDITLGAYSYGVSVAFEHTGHVECAGVPCSGFFDPELKLLSVATDRAMSDWTTTALHEFQHLRQWAEDCQEWRDFESVDAGSVLDVWVAGSEEFDPAHVKRAVSAVLNLELDCERRTIDFLSRYSLPISAEEYAQKANAYVLFYHEVHRSRRWYRPDLAPYRVERIWRRMPTSLWELDYDDADACLKLADFTQCFGEVSE